MPSPTFFLSLEFPLSPGEVLGEEEMMGPERSETPSRDSQREIGWGKPSLSLGTNNNPQRRHLKSLNKRFTQPCLCDGGETRDSKRVIRGFGGGGWKLGSSFALAAHSALW